MMGLSHKTIVDPEIVQSTLKHKNIQDLGVATIREIVTIVNEIEERSGVKFIRMEMGVPGLPPSDVGVNAEMEALKEGVASKYPSLDGIPEFKKQASRFVKAFMNVDISSECCVPTVGAMQGSYALFMAIHAVDPQKDTFLFIDPGFPVQKQQLKVLGYEYLTFDVFNYRGDKLKDKLISYLERGNICGIIYSNPNNPTWISLREQELLIIGELATLYDAIVIEDLAYFGMDFRKDISVPYKEPYQNTVAHYTNNFAFLISSSKVFSYAGQRIALMCISEKLYYSYFDSLKIRYGVGDLGPVIVGRLLYSLSAGTSHSSQRAVAAIYKAACDGKYNFIEKVKEYGFRSRLMKEIFINNGFEIIYSMDLDTPVADGFYFTVGFPGFTGGELLECLLYYGVSAIGLKNTGSEKEGIRACVSYTSREQLPFLNERLQIFRQNLH